MLLSQHVDSKVTWQRKQEVGEFIPALKGLDLLLDLKSETVTGSCLIASGQGHLPHPLGRGREPDMESTGYVCGLYNLHIRNMYVEFNK